MSCALESRRRRRAALIVGVGLATILSGCGQPDVDRGRPRPPVVIQVTGVITRDQVTLSPSRVGAGRIVLSVSNQDEDSHAVVLEGGRTLEQVGPINPQDTATIMAEVTQGSYAVRAGSHRAVSSSARIEPARLVVRPPRADRRERPAAAAGSAGTRALELRAAPRRSIRSRPSRPAEPRRTQSRAWPKST